MIRYAPAHIHPQALRSNTPMHTASGIAVRQYSGNDRQLGVKHSTDVGERIARFLRERHPTKTCEMVEAATQISAATVAKWLERASVPGGVAMLALTAAYGPKFLTAVMPQQLGWLDEATRAEQQRALQAEIDDCRARLAALG